jgi:light-regulated signal transduction histidine kinase (bacteriophytochrome)
MENWKEKYDALNERFDHFKQDYEEFIHFAAHDLDSPLRKLSTFVDRINTKYNDVQDENTKVYLGRINNCVAEMRSVVDSLYHLSIVNFEKNVIQNCDLKKIVAKVLNNLQEEIIKKDAVVETVDLPVISGNENQYMMLFKNVFENALRFSRKDVSPIVKADAIMLNKEEKAHFHLPEQKVYYKISVSDNGLGFKQERAADIFKPFVRLHGKSEMPGMGLGLSICKKIVENHKGLIYAEGVENSGARFVLILPQTQE